MRRPRNLTFEHDFDSNLYMISADPGARSWKVLVWCKGGRWHVPELEQFVPYPGCAAHEGEAAWNIEFFQPERIEIQMPGMAAVSFEHPDRQK
jgi:hypothetical protein